MTKKKDPKDLKKVGRPTKYRKEYTTGIIEYFRQDVIQKVENTIEGMGKNAWKKTEVRYEALFFPTLELYADSIGVDDDTLSNWANAKDTRGRLKHPEFFGAYTRAKAIQKGLLFKYGLIGKLDSRFAAFFASANLGMTPKSETEEHVTITTRKHRKDGK